jgi:hypothetical protein
MNRPVIINGVELTEGQSMTLYAALSNFAMDLLAPSESMGVDDVGKSLRQGYLNRLAELYTIAGFKLGQ